MKNIAQIFMDLDGVITSWPSYHHAQHNDIATFHSILYKLINKKIAKTVLTNRTSAQTFSIAYDLDARDSLFVCENGSILFDTSSQHQYLNPIYKDFVSNIRPALMSFLKLNLKINDHASDNFNFQFEPGGAIVKVNLIPKSALSKDEIIFLRELINKSSFSELVDIVVSKQLEFSPKGLDKYQGIIFLERTYFNKYGAKIDWKNSIFIADSVRDIRVASYLVKKGVTIASVGNSKCEYKNIVSKYKGIIAPDNTTYHGSVNYILKDFFKL